MRNKRILLVRIPEVEIFSTSTDLRRVTVSSLTVPLGVTTLAAVIRRDSDWDVKIADIYAEHYEQFIGNFRKNPYDVVNIIKQSLGKTIESYQPRVIGFSALFLFQHALVKELAHFVRENFPQTRLYAGGYPTVYPELVMEDIPELDVVFLGEGENSVLEVLNAESIGKSLSDVSAIAIRAGEHIQVNRKLNFVKDIESIPFPAFDMLPLDKYKAVFGRVEMPIMATRGCPFDCHYCSVKQYSAKRFRAPSPEYTLKSIRYLYDNYGMNFMYVRDDNFNVQHKFSKAVLRGICESDMKFQWINTSSFHVNSLDEEYLELCKASGCSEAIMAVESASPRVLKDIMNKKVDLEHAQKMADFCHKIDLPLQVYFVIGNPGESEEEIARTVDFAEKLQVDHCTFSIATPFPGTRYYEIAQEKGFIKMDKESILSMKYMDAIMSFENITADRIKDLQYEANIRVNFLKNRLLRGSLADKQKALGKYSRVSKQYEFHAIARLLKGFLLHETEKVDEGVSVYREVVTMLQDKAIADAYSRFFEWDTPATNHYRAWRAMNANP